MDYRKLDPDEYEILEGEKLENGIQQIILTDKKDRRFCEACLSVDVVKKCQTTRKVLDVVDKKPVQYIINRYRYRCNECKRTFIPEDFYEPEDRGRFCVLQLPLTTDGGNPALYPANNLMVCNHSYKWQVPCPLK